jgi:formyl-CoA transferase
MERPELGDDPRFTTLKDRVHHMDTIDEIVAGWTRGFAKEDLFALLMRHRVPCAPVRDLGEVTDDPHLHARGALRRVSHPLLGEVVLPTGAIRFESEPPPLTPSKDLGADNETILRGWLGLDEAQYRKHQQAGVL